MSVIEIHIQHFTLHEKGSAAETQVCKNICQVYDDEAINERTYQRWFILFCSGNAKTNYN